jgi:acetyl-CoA/propionyl-CoA carboxylase biotin carboxyl carrier protein
MTVPGAFDSLVGKLIVTGADRAQALERSRRALDEFVVAGMPTVIPFHRAVLTDPAFVAAGGAFAVHTRWIETEFDNPVAPHDAAEDGPDAPRDERDRVSVEVGGKRLEVVLPAGLASAGSSGPARRPARRARSAGSAAAVSGDALSSPMQGTIVKVAVEDGQQVAAGDLVVVLEAMKMEQPINAHKDGTVAGLAAQVGATVSSGEVICEISA